MSIKDIDYSKKINTEPDDKQQSLIPGDKQYKIREMERIMSKHNVNQNDLEKDLKHNTVNTHDVEKSIEKQRDKQRQYREEKADAFIKSEEKKENNVGEKQYRDRTRKRDKVEKSRSLIENGIDKSVNFEDKVRSNIIRDNGVTDKNVTSKTIASYRADLLEVCNTDNDKDGDVDEDDITPGMRRLSRYM